MSYLQPEWLTDQIEKDTSEQVKRDTEFLTKQIETVEHHCRIAREFAGLAITAKGRDSEAKLLYARTQLEKIQELCNGSPQQQQQQRGNGEKAKARGDNPGS